MAKSKPKRGGPPLFELLQGNRFRRSDAGPQRPELRVVHPTPDGADEDAAAESQVRLAASNDPVLVEGAKPAALQLQGDRLHLSLTPLTAAIGVFAISLLVMGAIYIGQWRGEKAILRAAASTVDGDAALVDTVEAVRDQPPASHLVESLLTANSSPAPSSKVTDPAVRKAPPAAKTASSTELPAGPQHRWVRDFTYIVTQEFSADRREDALRAQEFLAARGFPTEIIKLNNGALQLITLEGYNHKDPAQKKKADAILKKERAAGAEYFATGGGYKLEGYYKTLKEDRW